ncbi:CsbD family protein [Polymorphobacter arshaanensis]|uniref:CsbD family protein n=1 Tax=Glacieibacterium arshaanense TaxID=2511025 RepID=A0A4Y9EKT4_9SPHN|nr:CsbD family protein [Polymorphobacter arshaanensis]TFU01016.1 CsbD family protein [Polymorphobacter arshaanensis]
MGELIDKTKGLGNEIAGKAKTALGEATDNPKLTAEGDVQQVKGQMQNVKGSVKGALGDKI